MQNSNLKMITKSIRVKRIFFLLLFLSYWLFGIFIDKVLAEEIKNFSSKIYINKNGTINVEEKIIYDFGGEKRHGIFREIPFIKKNQEGKKFALDFFDFKVIDEKGKSYLFEKSKEGEDIKLKIGDPNKTISGVQTYLIFYKVAGAITYFSDHDELYWNMIGNKWQIPINYAKAEVFLPEKIDKEKIKTSCFTGFYGSKSENCRISFETDFNKDIIVVENSSRLAAGEGLSIVVGFPKNIVSILEPKEYKSFWESFLGKAVVFLFFLTIFIWYLSLPIYIIYRWFKYGRDPKVRGPGEVSAWFDPPKTPDGRRFLTPAEVGVLGDETVDLKDICATIVDLARRGYLRIEERKKGEFWLIKTKEENLLLSFEKKLLEEFFKNGNELNLKKRNLYDEIEEIKKAIYEETVKVGLFPENPQKTRTIMTILGFFALFTANFFLAIVAFIFGRNLPRKTIEGVKAKNIAFSLRNFLKSQERQLAFQAKNFNDLPAGRQVFEKLLPYAVAFGVEKIWAKRFANLDLKPPEWYKSYDQGKFNSIIFINNLNASFASFQSSFAPPTPTRSTRGFSSGFSSGFSGGGGGGGGGGSW